MRATKRLPVNQRLIHIKVTLTAAQLAVEPNEIAEYILDALGAWGGGGHPDSSLFQGLDVNSVEYGGQYFEAKP